MGPCQSTSVLTVTPLSRAGSLPHGISAAKRGQSWRGSLLPLGCSAVANRAIRFAWRNAGACCAGQREQAPSPQGLHVAGTISVNTRKTCGSELARDGALSVNIGIDCHTAIASRLAPTWDLCGKARAIVARELAPARLLSSRKPSDTVCLEERRGLLRRPAGASSLATGVTCGWNDQCEHPKNLWERACSRWGPVSQHWYRLSHRHREQARSHMDLRRKRSTAPVQLAHQLGLGLGQAAGLGQFVDAGAHAHQAGGLGEGQAGGVALFQLGEFVRQRRDHGT